MDTSAASDWIPEAVSAELHAQARLEMRVASLLRTVQMPTASYRLPVQGNRPVPYLVSENSGADDDLDNTKRGPASDVGLGASLTLNARKVGVRVVPSVELTEDSVIAALPLIREEIISALAVAREDSIINGKASGPHFDSDVTAANDHRKWYNGLRYFATAASAGNNQAVIAASTAGRLELKDIRSVREKMGKYAINPKECFWLTSVLGYNKLLGLVDSDGHQLVTTIDKFGSAATLVQGSIAALDGFGIVVSEHVRSDLNHAGYFDGLTSDAGICLLVNAREFVVGEYRTATLKSRELVETDQLALVAMTRGDFGCYIPTANPWGPVGMIYDIRRS